MNDGSGHGSSENVGRWAFVEGEESGKWLTSQFWGSGVSPWKIVEHIGGNLCNLVHFGDIRSSKVGQKIYTFRPTFKVGIFRPCRIGSAEP